MVGEYMCSNAFVGENLTALTCITEPLCICIGFTQVQNSS